VINQIICSDSDFFSLLFLNNRAQIEFHRRRTNEEKANYSASASLHPLRQSHQEHFLPFIHQRFKNVVVDSLHSITAAAAAKGKVKKKKFDAMI
jgi:hypothetical protein